MARVCSTPGWYVELPVFPGGCFLAATAAEFGSQPGPVRDALRDARDWLALSACACSTAPTRCQDRPDLRNLREARSLRDLQSHRQANGAGPALCPACTRPDPGFWRSYPNCGQPGRIHAGRYARCTVEQRLRDLPGSATRSDVQRRVRG